MAIAPSAREIKLLDVDSGRELATLEAPAPEPLRSLCFVPDGSRLVAGTKSGAIQLWDLHRIRARLRPMGLDWGPPARASRPDDGQPMVVAVDLGELADPEKCSLILALCPFDAEAYYRRGLAYARRGQPREALDDLRRALALKPDHAEAHYRRGLIRASQRKAEETIADFSRAIALKPDHAEAYAARGNAHHVRHAWELAAGDYAKVAKLRPDWHEFPNSAAWLFANNPDPGRRDPARAVDLALKAVQFEPDQAMYWNTLGVAHYRARHWKEAIEALTRSMGLSDGQAESYDTFFLAMAYWQLADKKEARRWYDRAVRSMENNPPSDAELVRIRAEAAETLQLEERAPSGAKKSSG
jgi:tetratricopeptide (TPR) repeat protein